MSKPQKKTHSVTCQVMFDKYTHAECVCKAGEYNQACEDWEKHHQDVLDEMDGELNEQE